MLFRIAVWLGARRGKPHDATCTKLGIADHTKQRRGRNETSTWPWVCVIAPPKSGAHVNMCFVVSWCSWKFVNLSSFMSSS